MGHQRQVKKQRKLVRQILTAILNRRNPNVHPPRGQVQTVRKRVLQVLMARKRAVGQ